MRKSTGATWPNWRREFYKSFAAEIQITVTEAKRQASEAEARKMYDMDLDASRAGRGDARAMVNGK